MKKPFLWVLFLLLASLFILSGCGSGGSGGSTRYATLSGCVVDAADERKLEGVKVTVGNKVTAYTNSEGYFKTGKFSLGAYRITFSRSGYQTVTDNQLFNQEGEWYLITDFYLVPQISGGEVISPQSIYDLNIINGKGEVVINTQQKVGKVVLIPYNTSMTTGDYAGRITISDNNGDHSLINLSSRSNRRYSLQGADSSFFQKLKETEKEVFRNYLNQSYRPSYNQYSLDKSSPPNELYFYKDVELSEPQIVEVQAELKNEGENCYVYVDKKAKIGQEDYIEALAKKFDDFYDNMIHYFGEVRMNIDGYNKIFLLLTDLYVGSSAKVWGYFWGVNEFPRSYDNPYSNEKEILFLTTVGAEESDWLETIISTAEHEFQHLINFTNRAPKVNSGYELERYYTETFINEGLSMVAEDIAIAGPGKHNVQLDQDRVIPYLENPDADSLCTWGGFAVDYPPAYMFMRYIVDRIGEENIQRIIQSPRFGTDSLLDAADEPSFLFLLREWLTAVYLDCYDIDETKYACIDLSVLEKDLKVDNIDSQMNIYLPDTTGMFLEKEYSPTLPDQITISTSGDDRFKLRVLMFSESGEFDFSTGLQMAVKR